MFANKYIQKHCNFNPYIHEKPLADVGIITVIPCIDEPDILRTLESLLSCLAPKSLVEVIIVINESEVADGRIRKKNEKTFEQIKKWVSDSSKPFIKFYPIYPIPLPKKWAGAGLARKIGMDEAIRRFNAFNNPKGIILSLDADTLVDKNYFTEVENYFLNHTDAIGANIRFDHIKAGIDAKLKEGIELYEAYMAYYKEAHAFIGFPFAMYTIGSAFAVTADAYVKQGGMVKRVAGEDFYFLNKLTTLGKLGKINSTCVYPSSRVSSRVPFGTGPNMRRWMTDETDLRLTYNLQAFLDLKKLFDRKDRLYSISENDFLLLLDELPEVLVEFLKKDQFFKQLNSLNKNCSSIQSFKWRFFHIFNAFKILKYLNYSHLKHYAKVSLREQIEALKTLNGLW